MLRVWNAESAGIMVGDSVAVWLRDLWQLLAERNYGTTVLLLIRSERLMAENKEKGEEYYV